MKKKMIIAGTVIAAMTGNVVTNVIIFKKYGWKFNKNTKRFEKQVPWYSLEEITMEERINKSNTIWAFASFILGVIVRKCILDKMD